MNKNQTLGVVALVIGVSFVFWLNCCYTFCSDDCHYGVCRFVAPESLNLRLGTLANVWNENIAAGYRPVVHFFVRAFTGVFDKWVFNVANALMWGLLIAMVGRVAKRHWCFDFDAIVLTITLVFLILCKGESYLWCAGSVNYLWTGVATLAFLLIRDRIEDQDHISWTQYAALIPVVFFIGWMQEAFSLPVVCALGCYALLHWRHINCRKVLVYAAYAVGAGLLILCSLERAHNDPMPITSFSIVELAKNALLVAAGAKAVWIMLLVLVIRADRKRIVQENLFELLVVFATISMIALVGFNGERSLWLANLASIIVVVRECNPTRWVSVSLSAIMLIVFIVVSFLGFRIKHNFDSFVAMYEKAEDGVCVHERVNCGMFSRFFYQSIYSFQEGFHPTEFMRFHGRNTLPVALSRKLYEQVYLTNTFCTAENKLSVEGDYYAADDVEAVVYPMKAEDSWMTNAVVHITYAPASGIVGHIKRQLDQRNPPPVSKPTHPVVLHTRHGDFLLCSKLTHCDKAIRKIEVLRK